MLAAPWTELRQLLSDVIAFEICLHLQYLLVGNHRLTATLGFSTTISLLLAA